MCLVHGKTYQKLAQKGIRSVSFELGACLHLGMTGIHYVMSVNCFWISRCLDSQLARFQVFHTPTATADELSDPNLRPLPAQPGVKYIARSRCCILRAWPPRAAPGSPIFGHRRHFGGIWLFLTIIGTGVWLVKHNGFETSSRTVYAKLTNSFCQMNFDQKKTKWFCITKRLKC